MNQFLIPANIKRGKLILGLFFPIDAIIFGVGLLVSLIALLIISSMDVSVLVTILAILPLAISVILVIPIPNYHNVRVGIGEIINFYTNIRNYKWRGWCVSYESKRK